tara:strand:- start:246 stop:782 length:537 start_codon:yes stop_codon:yes gene_type:complete
MASPSHFSESSFIELWRFRGLVLLLHIVMAVFFLLDFLPFSLWPEVVSADIILICIVYWSLYKPEIFPLWLAFLYGLATDLLSGTVPGLHAVFYTILSGFVLMRRRPLLSQSFPILWLSFASMILLLKVLIDLPLLLSSSVSVTGMILYDVTLTALLFPGICVFLFASRKILDNTKVV